MTEDPNKNIETQLPDSDSLLRRKISAEDCRDNLLDLINFIPVRMNKILSKAYSK